MNEWTQKHMNQTRAIFLILLLASCINKEPKENTPITDHKVKKKESLVAHQEVYNDQIDTQRSSWIDELHYSENQNGYSIVIMQANGNEYIYYRVPRELWNEWKNAPSLGRFYNQNVKGNYTEE